MAKTTSSQDVSDTIREFIDLTKGQLAILKNDGNLIWVLPYRLFEAVRQVISIIPVSFQCTIDLNQICSHPVKKIIFLIAIASLIL
ncbi:MAG: hypothetical protein MJE68_03885 [Proteobacteria bacterium]|nr:hypothetical protein [Pseudomonadota bacterium]